MHGAPGERPTGRAALRGRSMLVRSRPARWCAAAISLLPSGNRLSPRIWERRHRVIVHLAMLQSLFVLGFGLWRGYGLVHTGTEAFAVVAFALMARYTTTSSHAVRSGLATLSLFTASAMLVHQASGVTEWHFHFFVMVGLITLYQDWTPFLVAIVFVVVHHGLLGTFDPQGVYGNPVAGRAPWQWALLHGAFVLAAASVHVAAWRLSEEQGSTDPVTGLLNRLGFTDLVDSELQRGASIAVLYIDLDGFKAVNDSLGHAAGDEVLRRAAARMRDATKHNGRAARLGGDEFAVVVACPHALTAARSAERLLLSLADPVFLPEHGREVHVRASLGIAMAEAGVGGVELVRRADMAMYSAKGAGGARFAIFEDGMEREQLLRAQLADDLRHAVTRGQLSVVYQPTIDLGSGRVTGVEALLRWNHPAHGVIQPSTFIPLAEEGGSIVEIGDWVLTEAVRQVAAWRREGLDLSLAVNVSARQLDDAGFVDRLVGLLGEEQLGAEHLLVELTESVLVRDVEEVGGRLRRLRDHGVRVAIDDFGTGYSSMSYLRRLPVDVVKIDQSFVRDMVSGTTELALVRSIIELATTLNMRVVAEGVEKPAQAEALRTLRCATGQGYLWSRPVEASAIPGLAARRVDEVLAS